MWRKIDNARSIPHLFAVSIPRHVKIGLCKSPPHTRMILGGLAFHLGEKFLTKNFRKRLKVAIRELFEKARAAREAAAKIMDSEPIGVEEGWKALLQAEPFVFALSGSEQQAYSGFYFAYENFLARALEVKTGEWPRPTSKVGTTLKSTFGEAIWAQCWNYARFRSPGMFATLSPIEAVVPTLRLLRFRRSRSRTERSTSSRRPPAGSTARFTPGFSRSSGARPRNNASLGPADRRQSRA